MITDTQKSEMFLNAINEEANKRYKKIKQDIDRYIQSELDKAKEAAKIEVKILKKDETDRLNEQNNAGLSELEARETKHLIQTRQNIANDIFSKAEKEIVEFTKKYSYVEFLRKSIAEIQNQIGENSIIILRPDDKKYENELKDFCNEIRYDDSIILGGCKAENTSAKLIADDTLDSRFIAAKKDFYSSSGLSITL